MAGRLAADALPALSNPRTEAVIEDWPIGRRRCRAWFAVESGPRGERASRRTENRDRTGWNAPKLTTYAARVRIVDGDDGRTYIARDVGSHINVMRGDMERDAANVFPRDPRWADTLSLFGSAPRSGPFPPLAEPEPAARGAAVVVDSPPPRLPDGTRVHVRSEHFEEECDGVVREGEYDGGWLYRIEVTGGDRLDAHRTPPAEPRGLWNPGAEGELWVCDFEVRPIRPAAPAKRSE